MASLFSNAPHRKFAARAPIIAARKRKMYVVPDVHGQAEAAFLQISRDLASPFRLFPVTEHYGASENVRARLDAPID